MYESLRLSFWWPHLRHDIERYVEDCDRCTRTRMPVPTRKAPLQIFSASSRFEVVHMDILGGGASWPKTPRDNRYILVIVDHFSKFAVAVPLVHQKAEDVADAFFTHWVLRFGCPMRLHTDQGANFESTLFAELCAKCHVAKSRTMAYNPQSNGAVERLNRTLLGLLRACVCDSPAEWDMQLPQVLFAYNTTPHATTQRSPFFLVHGEEARLPCELITGAPSDCQSTNEFVRNYDRS